MGELLAPRGVDKFCICPVLECPGLSTLTFEGDEVREGRDSEARRARARSERPDLLDTRVEGLETVAKNATGTCTTR